MEKDYSRREFLKKGLKVFGGLVASSSLLSFSGCKRKVLFDDKIDGIRVVYSKSGPWDDTNKMEIYDKKGKLIRIIKDYDLKGTGLIYDKKGIRVTQKVDGEEIIGDHYRDRYVVFPENDRTKKIIYAKNFIYKNGIKFKRKDLDSVVETATVEGEYRLGEATDLFRYLKDKIREKVEHNLRRR